MSDKHGTASDRVCCNKSAGCRQSPRSLDSARGDPSIASDQITCDCGSRVLPKTPMSAMYLPKLCRLVGSKSSTAERKHFALLAQDLLGFVTVPYLVWTLGSFLLSSQKLNTSAVRGQQAPKRTRKSDVQNGRANGRESRSKGLHQDLVSPLG